MVIYIYLFLYSALAFFLVGCGEKDVVLARIDDITITESEFSRQMKMSPAQYEGYLNTRAGMQKYLEVLVNEKIIVKAACREGMDKHESVKKEIGLLRAEYEEKLRDYQEKLLIRNYLQKQREQRLRVSDEEIEEYYTEHESDFTDPYTVTVSHILLDSDADARAVLERLKKGEHFGDLVKKVSLDAATRELGGILPPFTKGNMLTAFKDVIFTLKINEISDVVSSEYGYHILRKVKEERLPPMKKNEARDTIQKILEKDKFMNVINALYKDFNVSINYDYFNADLNKNKKQGDVL